MFQDKRRRSASAKTPEPPRKTEKIREGKELDGQSKRIGENKNRSTPGTTATSSESGGGSNIQKSSGVENTGRNLGIEGKEKKLDAESTTSDETQESPEELPIPIDLPAMCPQLVRQDGFYDMSTSRRPFTGFPGLDSGLHALG
eukprot:CAMPEP_0197518934 /NCGR_PEP_ID=MMETSP1318-20131121/4199_1 /TAXON_ID=552666 /ORGANISM="Partenskyella glossopodia, Strain RCC365" /LENGTH=143 /DNA_ID=CAMNT_0043069641 /DNA_START=159 /DNA_END=590 /DNA_ORIENTATION=+